MSKLSEIVAFACFYVILGLFYYFKDKIYQHARPKLRRLKLISLKTAMAAKIYNFYYGLQRPTKNYKCSDRKRLQSTKKVCKRQ